MNYREAGGFKMPLVNERVSRTIIELYFEDTSY